MSVLMKNYQWILAIILGAAIGPLLTQTIANGKAPNHANSSTVHTHLTSNEEIKVKNILAQFQQKTVNKKTDIHNIMQDPDIRGLSAPAREQVISALTMKEKDREARSDGLITAAN